MNYDTHTIDRVLTEERKILPKGLSKSKGHLEFIGNYEYFLESNNLYKANKEFPINQITGNRNGEFEARKENVEDRIKMIKMFAD